jgi:hypothetical protein
MNTNNNTCVLVNWGGKLLTIQDTTRWLGFYLDPFLNWRAHVKIRVQQGLWRQPKVARFMQRWGINRKLARTVAWSTSMATAAYGIEAIWEGQLWIVQSFHKLTARIGRDVSGTFSFTMGVDAIREAATPRTRAALDRRTERQFIRMITNSNEHPCKNYVDEWDQDPEFGSLGRWITRSSDGLGYVVSM